MQLEVCREQVEWARSEKRTFLRQRIEARLATLYLGTKDFPAALQLIGKLLTEVGPGMCCAWTPGYMADHHHKIITGMLV